jgi:Family of unknown function (DUF5522)
MPVQVLILGEDYYLENDCYVFTAPYHLKRGYCCGSGCRHCPYPKTEKDLMDTKAKEEALEQQEQNEEGLNRSKR